MTDTTIAGRSSQRAILLLAAAEHLGLRADVVRTTSAGYIVPQGVADEAGLTDADEEADAPVKKPVAKKAAAKKAPAKKAAASKPKGEE